MLKQCFDFDREAFRCGSGSETLDYTAVAVDQEFREVPLDPLASKQTARFLLQVLEKRVRIVAIGTCRRGGRL